MVYFTKKRKKENKKTSLFVMAWMAGRTRHGGLSYETSPLLFCVLACVFTCAIVMGLWHAQHFRLLRSSARKTIRGIIPSHHGESITTSTTPKHTTRHDTLSFVHYSLQFLFMSFVIQLPCPTSSQEKKIEQWHHDERATLQDYHRWMAASGSGLCLVVSQTT